MIRIEVCIGKAVIRRLPQRIIGVFHHLDVIVVHRDDAVGRLYLVPVNQIHRRDYVSAPGAGGGERIVRLRLPTAHIHDVECDHGGRLFRILVELLHQPRGDITRPVGVVSVFRQGFFVDRQDAYAVVRHAGPLIQGIRNELIERVERLGCAQGKTDQKGRRRKNDRFQGLLFFHIGNSLPACLRAAARKLNTNDKM